MGYQAMNQQQRRISQTEKSVFDQLPGDIFAFDSKALDRAASFGLVPMQEGWIAGGIIGKLALSRMRSERNGDHLKMRPDFNLSHSPGASSQSDAIDSVDPRLPAKSLFRLRIDLVKRGLIT
jgi:hypothetical protein